VIPYNPYVSLKVYNLLGEEITELAGKQFSTGRLSVIFNSSRLTSGAYFYIVKAREFNFIELKKMLLIK